MFTDCPFDAWSAITCERVSTPCTSPDTWFACAPPPMPPSTLPRTFPSEPALEQAERAASIPITAARRPIRCIFMECLPLNPLTGKAMPMPYHAPGYRERELVTSSVRS
jgi:hypothetical protein